MNILLVDSNRFYSSVLTEMLHKAGFDATGYAENGIMCLLQLNKFESTDVVIIDESHCFEKGIDIVKNIRISRPSTRIIVLTSDKSALHVHHNNKKKSILYISKDSINSENLPKILYTIFTENLNSVYQAPVNRGFSSFSKSFANIVNS